MYQLAMNTLNEMIDTSALQIKDSMNESIKEIAKAVESGGFNLEGWLNQDFSITLDNYVKISETKQALKATSPFSITLTTDRRLWYEIKSDDLVKSEQVLPIGDNHLHRFKNKINIKFNQTLGLNLYLNKNNLSLIISIPDKTVSILQYSPKK